MGVRVREFESQPGEHNPEKERQHTKGTMTLNAATATNGEKYMAAQPSRMLGKDFGLERPLLPEGYFSFGCHSKYCP